MKLVRTFHPVGHGAFYTERFYDESDQPVFTAVFDCGSITDLQKLQQEINGEFKEGTKNINAVFLSHFHEDHLNGLDHLLTTCIVQNIVIPNMPQDIIVYTMLQNALLQQGQDSIANDRISSIMSGEDNNKGYKIIRIDENENKDAIIGETLPSSLRRIWEFHALVLPCKSQKYRHRLQNLTKTLQKDTTFSAAFKRNGCIDYLIFNNLLKNRGNISHLQGLVGQNSLQGNHYNMVVGSRPSDKRMYIGCLYTGDAMLKCKSRMNQFKNKFTINTPLYSCIQVPHHGVVGDNHNKELYQFPKESIVSVRNGDLKRPAKIVQDDIVNNGGNCIIVTENSKSVRHQYVI